MSIGGREGAGREGREAAAGGRDPRGDSRERKAAGEPREGDSGRGPSGQDAEVGKTERILNLVSCLLKERRPVPWREIANRVVGYDDGSDPRSLERRFERDKAALKEMGVRIVYCPPGQYETEGYLIPREACFLDKLELLPHESALLDLLSELALRKGGAAFSADLMSALQKLRFDASVRARPAAARAAGAAAGATAAGAGAGGRGGGLLAGKGGRPIVFPLPESEVEDAGKLVGGGDAGDGDGASAGGKRPSAGAIAAAPSDPAAPAPPEKKKRGRPRKTPPPDVEPVAGVGKAAGPGRGASAGAGDDEPAFEAEAGRTEGAAPTPLESSLLDLDLAGALRADPNVEVLTHALLANRAVAFTYTSVRSEETRRREVDPYGIGYSRGAWYVVGWDHAKKDIRQFRLDRIHGAVEPVGPERAFKPSKGFRVNDYLEKPTWEMADAPAVEVEIEVAPSIAFFVEDLHVIGEARPGAEPGSARVKLEVRSRQAFVNWALAHLRHVRVIQPAEMRAELGAAIEAIRGKHV